MSLHEMQTVLARLYVETAFRRRFFADRVSVLSEFDLTEAEHDALLRLSEAQIERFARSLHKKRRTEVLPLIPWSAARLGDRFAALFAAHCDAYQPHGLLKPGDDAIAFCEALSRRADLDFLTRETLRWEAARMANRMERYERRFQLFRCYAGRSAEEVESVPTVAPGVTLVWRWRDCWREWRWQAPFAVSDSRAASRPAEAVPRETAP